MDTIVIADQIEIPGWVVDFDTFRRWCRSPDYPETGQFAYLAGTLWVDPGMERVAHNQIKGECSRVLKSLAKGEIARVLSGLAKTTARGIYFGDRMLLTNAAVELSTEPDGMFVSAASLARELVKIVEGDEAIEVIGSPDMTLEVISQSSVEKDTVLLRRLYWEAKVREYWLVDSRRRDAELVILRRGRTNYRPVRKQEGWVKSAVFESEFRLTRSPGLGGITEFTLEAR
jgi:Uma2 family endonuclease